MDFISNLIKRPISLVRSDSLPSTPEPTQTAARTERSATPESHNQLIANALNDSLVASNIMDALNLCDEFRPLAATTPPRASPPLNPTLIQPFARALQTTSSNNNNGSGTNATTTNTIEELLIQINDNLNMSDLDDDQHANLPHPLSKPSSTAELNAICSKSANAKVPSSPLTKEASPLKSVAMAPVAETVASAPILNKQHNETVPKGGLFSTSPTATAKNDAKINKSGNGKTFAGLTEFDETVIPELPTNLNINTDEHIKLTFEDGLIPTLTADINQHQKHVPFFMKDDTFNKTPNQLSVANDPDTAASSDNETFAECQTYQDGGMSFNVDMDYMAYEQSIETSQLDAYFSAANSRNTTMTYVPTDPLNITMDKTPEPEMFSDKNMAILTTPTSSKTNVTDNIVMPESDLFEDEPMDVDISLSELKLQADNVLTTPCKDNSNSDTVKSEEEESVVVKPIDSTMSASFVTQHDTEKTSSSPQSIENVQPELSKADSAFDEVLLNKSVESPPLNAQNSTNTQEHLGSSTTITASEVSIDLTQNPDTSANTSNSSVLENGIEQKAAQELTCNKSIQEPTEVNLLNTTVEMNTSSSSSKSSASSTNFPLKQKTNMKQFPRSPTKIVEKEMPFLEKSEYTERIEIERKKSTSLSPNSLKFVESKKTTAEPEVSNTTLNIDTVENGKCDALYKTEDVGVVGCKNESISKVAPEVNTNNDKDIQDDKKCPAFGIETAAELRPIVADVIPQPDNNVVEADKRRTFNLMSLQDEAEAHSEKIDMNVDNEEKRRTFVMSVANEKVELHESFENRRTFNVQPSTSADGANAEIEVMDIDDTLQSAVKDVTPIAGPLIANDVLASPPIPTLQNRSKIDTTSSASPPIPALQSHTKFESTYSTSPPIPTLQKERQVENEFKMTESPPVPALQNRQANIETFKVPPVPTQRSSPTANALTRPPIHTSATDAFKVAANAEVLSAKEQTKSVACDEKDVFVGNGTPSPMEEMPSPKAFGGFGSALRVDVDEQEFTNADFQNSHNLIFNPSDFDYLLTKGNNSAPVDRSSILLKFDPLLGVPVPANQVQPPAQQQLLQQLLGGNIPTLSPTIEEDEHSSTSSSSHGNNQSFVVDNKRRSVGLNSSTADSAKSRESSVKSSPENPTAAAAVAATQPRKVQQQNHAANTKKHASMSVDVIKDMNVDNDCNKSFENSNSQPDEKQMNYKMDELEKKIKNEVLKTEDIEKKLKDAEQREEALIKRITDKDKTITKMTGVIEAYEKAIAELIAEKEQLMQNYEKQLAEVKSDRDSNYQHLTSLETTFSDLHVKYEKSKEMTLQLKSNEESLVSEKRQILENLRLQEQRYDKMKNHAMQQLEIANRKLESLSKEHSIETTKLKALLKKEEISRASISEQLLQKSRENAELVKICDELINGQGS